MRGSMLALIVLLFACLGPPISAEKAQILRVGVVASEENLAAETNFNQALQRLPALRGTIIETSALPPPTDGQSLSAFEKLLASDNAPDVILVSARNTEPLTRHHLLLTLDSLVSTSPILQETARAIPPMC